MRRWRIIIYILLIAIFLWRYQRALPLVLPSHYFAKPHLVQGTIERFQKITTTHTNFIFQLAHSTQRLYLSWYTPTPILKSGQVWQLAVHLKPPHGLHNFVGFDFERWLLARQISAVGSVIAHGDNKLLTQPKDNGLAYWRNALRDYVQLRHLQQQASILTLLLGERAEMTSQQWTILQITGTNHLFAIAGLHLSALIGMVILLLLALIRRIPTLTLCLARDKIICLLTPFFILPYAIFSGFALPARRAVIMLLVYCGCSLLHRRVTFWQRLGCAMVVILLLQPLAIYDISFYLSIAAMLLIGGIISINQAMPNWQRWLWLQSVLFIGLMPLTVYFFHQLSLLGWLANAVAIPWMTLVVMPLCFLACVLFLINKTWALLIFKLLALALTWLWWWLSWLSRFHLHELFYPFAVWQVVLAFVAVILFIALPLRCWRWLFCLMALPLFFYKPSQPAAGAFWLTVLDVGQGLASVIQTQHHVLIYDAGPKTYGGFDAGIAVVLPYLKWQRLSHVDMMMISHPDMDHRGGAQSILQNIAVATLLTSAPRYFKQAKACVAGQHWRWDGVVFRVLAPGSHQPAADNNSSCVLAVSNGRVSALLPGDIEAAQEAWLLRHHHDKLAADVLVVPHHGSQTSSTWPFVEAVSPKAVIFATGYYNRYHFPASLVVARYKLVGSQLYSTACDGAVRIELAANGAINIKTVVRNTLCHNTTLKSAA